MDFEDILEDVGSFGFYQKTLVLLFTPVLMAIPCFNENLLFMTSTPEHWCDVPEVKHSNFSLNFQKQLIRPPQDPSCSMYDVNYSALLSSENWTIDLTWPTKKCENGWQYDTTDYDNTAVTRWNMVCDDSHYSSLVLSLTFVGSILGSSVYGFLSDRYGRKFVFLCLCAVTAVTDITSVMSPIFCLFLIIRTINGTSMANFYATGYIILLELVGKDTRSLINSIGCNAWAVGLCLLPLLAWLTRDWIRLSITTTVACASILLYYFIIPNSPSWLISRGRYEEAAEVMAEMSKINGTDHSKEKLLQRIKCVGENMKKQKESAEKYTILDLVRYPILKRRLFLISICWISTYLCYFGTQINLKALAGNEFLNFFLGSVVEIPAHMLAWYCMERLGRRLSSIGSFLFTAVACLVPVVVPQAKYFRIDVAASIFAKIGASASYMVMFQQGSELLPTCVRGMGVGVGTSVAMGSTFFGPYIIYLAKYGDFLPFLSFSIIAFTGAVVSSFLPETLNKKLPQTIADLENFEESQRILCCSKSRKEKTVIPRIPSLSDIHSSDKNPATLNVNCLSPCDHASFEEEIKNENTA